ncbi:MAG: hypothetical protein QW520_06210 [Methanomassiliicoccales archaeon]
MTTALTVSERILLYVSQYQRFKDNFDVPFDLSQDGIAQALIISRAHAAVELKKLREAGYIEERLAHIKRGKNKRKVYFLTEKGEERATKIREFAIHEGIDTGPSTDIRKLRGKELYESLSEQNRRVLEMASVFRRAFLRDALPETSIALLPVNRDGMVELPAELRREVMAILPHTIVREAHSFAADYWLSKDEYRERLYHLISANRKKEAEMLLAAKGSILLKEADEDLFNIISCLDRPSERYAAKIRSIQGECARLVKNYDYCFKVCDEMIKSRDPGEKFDGLLNKGRALKDVGRIDDAIEVFIQAKSMGSQAPNPCLEMEMAEALIMKGDFGKALTLMSSLASRGALSDPESIEKGYLLMGTANLRLGSHAEALRYLSKSLAITKAKDKTLWYKRLAEAYSLAGMPEKAKEYEIKANPPKKWGQEA